MVSGTNSLQGLQVTPSEIIIYRAQINLPLGGGGGCMGMHRLTYTRINLRHNTLVLV